MKRTNPEDRKMIVDKKFPTETFDYESTHSIDDVIKTLSALKSNGATHIEFDVHTDYGDPDVVSIFPTKQHKETDREFKKRIIEDRKVLESRLSWFQTSIVGDRRQITDINNMIDLYQKGVTVRFYTFVKSEIIEGEILEVGTDGYAMVEGKSNLLPKIDTYRVHIADLYIVEKKKTKVNSGLHKNNK